MLIAELEIIKLRVNDVVTTSGDGPVDPELPPEEI